MIFRTIVNINKTACMVISALERGQKGALLLAFLIMVLTGFFTNIPAVVLGYLVDSLINAGAMPFARIVRYLLAIAFAILAREGLTVWRKYLVEKTCTRVEKSRLVRLVDHVLRLEMDYYSSIQVGALNGKIHRSIDGLVRIVKLLFLDFFPSCIAAMVAIVIAIVKSPLLGGIMALAIPAGFSIILWQISSQEGVRIALLRDKEAIDGKVVELLSGIESVRAANTENFETKRVDVLADRLRKKEIRHHISMALFDCAKSLIEGTFHIALIATSVYLVTQGVITTGDVLAYSLLFLSAVTPLREIHRILDEAHESSIRVRDLYELCAQPIDKSFSVMPVDKARQKNLPAIRISNLSHSYSSDSNGTKTKILDGINLEIYSGNTLGIAGPSGGGKSTLLKFILGFYHAEQSSVSLDGMSIEALSRDQIADLVGYVPQSPFIFAGTIRENVTYGCGSMSEDDIHEACRRACIHDEILQSLGGYDGVVAERGQNLSGGQRQRLAIARIILKKPSIVLLDEATAALDNINEKEVQKGLERLVHGRTVVTVAHRLTTLRKTDRIIVLDKGRIVETGTYSDLQNSNGLFAKLEHAVAG